MDKKAVLTVISDFRNALELVGVKSQKIILFGSYATGRYDEASDIDVVVVSEDFRDKGYWERIDLLADAIYKVFKPIEAVAMTPEEWQTGDSRIADFARRGEVVYGSVH